MSHKVKLTYFKPSGKYYSQGEYQSDEDHAFNVFDEVKTMQREGKLPGLVEGGGKHFFIHLDPVEHPLGYPALIHPLEQ